MAQGEFNPHGYEDYSDIPSEHLNEFVPVENGFVEASAQKPIALARLQGLLKAVNGGHVRGHDDEKDAVAEAVARLEEEARIENVAREQASHLPK